MTGFFLFQRDLLRKLTPIFLNVETIECFVSQGTPKIRKQPLVGVS